MSEFTHKEKIYIIEKFVKPENLVKQPKSWAREMKLLNQLRQAYNEKDFWMNLNIGDFKLNSLAWFKMADGKAEIEKYWRFYLHEKTQKKPLDETSKLTSIETNIPELPKRTSALEWAN